MTMDITDMTLIGRDCWTSFCSLRRGTIIEQHFNPDYCTVRYENGEKQTVTSSFIHLTSQGAKDAREENADYWRRKGEEL